MPTTSNTNTFEYAKYVIFRNDCIVSNSRNTQRRKEKRGQILLAAGMET